jgi:S-adenosyl methyltransferase
MVPDGRPLQRPVFRPLPASSAVRDSHKLRGGQRRVRADRIDEPTLHPRLTALIDITQPVALLLVAIMHFITDDENPSRIIATFRDALFAGSYAATRRSPRCSTAGTWPTLAWSRSRCGAPTANRPPQAAQQGLGLRRRRPQALLASPAGGRSPGTRRLHQPDIPNGLWFPSPVPFLAPGEGPISPDHRADYATPRWRRVAGATAAVKSITRSLGGWEGGGRYPHDRWAAAICQVLGVAFEDFPSPFWRRSSRRLDPSRRPGRVTVRSLELRDASSPRRPRDSQQCPTKNRQDLE